MRTRTHVVKNGEGNTHLVAHSPHSFGSYRMEMVKNAGPVALEMGNSAAIVMKHYFDVVEKSAAAAYFDIRPVSRGDRKIVTLR